MLFIRDVSPNNFLSRMDLNVMTRNPLSTYGDLVLYNMLLQAPNLENGYAVPLDYVDGFCEVPNTYHITTPAPNVCVYCKAHEEPINFIWDNKIAITIKVETDSLVFLPIQGSSLTYDDDKILYIRCVHSNIDTANIMFMDSYGQPQYATLSRGKVNLTDNVSDTFKSYQGQLTYQTNKQPLNAFTLGQNGIKSEMMLFYSGFVNSPAYGFLKGNELLECSVTDASLTAERATKLYALDSVLQIETKNLDKI